MRAMKPAARPISNQRIDRALLWSQLWLLRIAKYILETVGAVAPLGKALERALAPSLTRLTKLVFALIANKALAQLPSFKFSKPQTWRKNPSRAFRALFGVRLRRLARARDVRARIAALLMLIANVAKEAARFARRIRNGLTSRLGGFVRESADAIVWVAPCFSALCADTS